jgi:hypothetical protein
MMVIKGIMARSGLRTTGPQPQKGLKFWISKTMTGVKTFLPQTAK